MSKIAKQNNKLTEKDKEFYKKMFLVGIPVIIQNLLAMGLNMIDTLMIGRLGEEPLAGVGSANQIFFVYQTLLFGLFSGASVFIAQYWGTRDVKNIRKIFGIDVVIAVVAGISICIIATLLAPKLIWLFSREESVICYGSLYLRKACFSFIFFSLSYAVVFNSRGIQRLKAATVINGSALVLNTLLNYMLIYGKFGAEAMGVEGAALATLIARIIEFSAFVAYLALSKDHPYHASIGDFISFSGNQFRNVMKTAFPVILTEGGWALSVTVTFAAYGMMGHTALAIVQVVAIISDLSQCLYFGLGNASAVIIGESLGRGDIDYAYKISRKVLKITWILNFAVTVGLIAISRPLSEIYHFNAETTHLLRLVIIAWALTTTMKMMPYIYIVGILRAGGDTVFGFITDFSCNMLINVPMAFFGILVLNLPLYFVVFLAELGEIVKTVLCIARHRSKKWMNIVT